MRTSLFNTGPFLTERGSVLSWLRLAYRTWGTLNADGSNVVWICHALTGSADADVWWSEIVGPGRVIDTTKYFVVCANMPGSCYGSSGPTDINLETGKIIGLDFPVLTARDIVRFFDALRSYLGIERIRLLIGGSMGGQHVLEWAVSMPHRIESIVPIATNARHSPWGIAFNAAQRMALEADPTFMQLDIEAGQRGLEAARAIGMLSYRTSMQYDATQHDEDSVIDGFRAESYQRYQGAKLTHRFNAHSYWILSKAMDAHNVGRDRGGVERALQTVTARTLVIGVDTDLLFPTREQKLIADMVPRAAYRQMQSIAGHDAFLLDQLQLSNILRNERILEIT
ncbi:MAG: homoserine O-acetyltransferase [Candidatus Kapabacteria bacterium]|nr:homoserine O-acetyltransferase [Candidatus Kapabacteria bacterium]